MEEDDNVELTEEGKAKVEREKKEKEAGGRARKAARDRLTHGRRGAMYGRGRKGRGRSSRS